MSARELAPLRTFFANQPLIWSLCRLYDDCGRNYLFDIGYWSSEWLAVVSCARRALNFRS